MTNEVHVLLDVGCYRSMDVAVVDGDVTAFVLHHHHSIVVNVDSSNLQILQRYIISFVKCYNSVNLRILIIAVAARGVLVVIDLHIALTAFTLDGQRVRSTHTYNIRYANLLVVFTCSDLQRHGSIHA